MRATSSLRVSTEHIQHGGDAVGCRRNHGQSVTPRLVEVMLDEVAFVGLDASVRSLWLPFLSRSTHRWDNHKFAASSKSKTYQIIYYIFQI